MSDPRTPEQGSTPGPEFGPDLAEVFGPAARDGDPELVQLLTPEGERVHHPEFDLDFDADFVAKAPPEVVEESRERRVDFEATLTKLQAALKRVEAAA